MRRQMNHVIDSIFPIALFFVFLASSLLVLLLATHIYEETTYCAWSNSCTRTSYSYVIEKIRQNDEDGQISVKELEGTTCLLLYSNSTGFTTYIYSYDGYLKELRMRQGLDFQADAGTNLIQCESFKPEIISDLTGDALIVSLNFTEDNGDCLTTYIAERSEQ